MVIGLCNQEHDLHGKLKKAAKNPAGNPAGLEFAASASAIRLLNICHKKTALLRLRVFLLFSCIIVDVLVRFALNVTVEERLMSVAIPLTPEQIAKRVEALEPKLRSYAHKFTYNDDAVEDLLQELRITAFKKRKDYDPSTGDAGLKTWLKSILTNIGLRYRKNMALRREISWNGHSEGENDEPASRLAIQAEYALIENDGFALMEQQEEERWSIHKLQCRGTYYTTKLAPRQRECIEALINHESQATTAKRLGISQPVVSGHVQAAIKKLRKSHKEKWGNAWGSFMTHGLQTAYTEDNKKEGKP